MSQKIAKLSRKVGQKAFDQKARQAIFEYLDRLCREPLHVRLAYAWRFIRGRNPHTGIKVPRPKMKRVRIDG